LLPRHGVVAEIIPRWSRTEDLWQHAGRAQLPDRRLRLFGRGFTVLPCCRCKSSPTTSWTSSH